MGVFLEAVEREMREKNHSMGRMMWANAYDRKELLALCALSNIEVTPELVAYWDKMDAASGERDADAHSVR